MKALIRNSFVLILFASLFSCITQIPLSVSPSENNKTYAVEYLFEHDGCKVYRFRDMGHYVYFTNCNNAVSSIENDSTEIKVFDSAGIRPVK